MEKTVNSKILDSLNGNWQDKLLFLTLLLSVTYYKITPLCLVILFILVLIQGKEKVKSLKQDFNWNNGLFWAVIFYGVHLLGLLWSQNITFGLSDLGMKLSFLLIPLIFMMANFSLSAKRILTNFSYALSLIVLLMLLFSIWRSIYYPEDNNWGYFFETEFSIFIHRSYWATYSAFASGVILVRILENYTKLKWFDICAWMLLSLSTFFTISKAGIIIWFSLTFFIVTHRLFLSRHGRKTILILGISGLFCGIFLFSNSKIRSRFSDISTSIAHIKSSNNETVESSGARLVMWSTSWSLIKENWVFGVGTGDVKDLLIKKNIEKGNIGAAERKLNSHNQFLNTWVQLGIVGLVSLLMLFVMTLKQAIQTKTVFGFLFIICFGITMLFESFVETQAGIIPFCILFCVINTKKH